MRRATPLASQSESTEGTLSRARATAACRLALLVPLSLQLSGCAALRALIVPAPVAAGQRVWVDVPTATPPTRVGRLEALTEDSLILGRDSTAPVADPSTVVGRLALSLDLVDAFAVSRGIHRNILNGSLIGGIVGFLGGLALLCTRIHDCLGHGDTDPPISQTATMMMVSAGAGALIGGSLGFFVRSEQWDDVPRDLLGRQRVAPSQQPAARLRAGFSLFLPLSGPRRTSPTWDR